MDTASIDTALMAAIGMGMLLASASSIILLVTFGRKHPADPAQLTSTIQQRSWSRYQVVMLLFAFIGLALLLSFIQPGPAHTEHPAVRLIFVLSFSAAQVAMLLVIGRKRQRGWIQDFGMDFRRLKLLPVSLAIYFAMLPALGILTMAYHAFLYRVFGIDPYMQEVAYLISDSQAWTRIGFILLAVVVAPLYEELIFRGVLFSYLSCRIGFTGSIVAVSIIFALIHFHIPSVFPLFLLSIVLCMAYWRTGSLWTSIGVHALFNSVTIIVLLLTA